MPLLRTPSGRLRGGLERLLASDVSPMLAERSQIAFDQRVAQAKFQGIEAHLMRNHVHVAFDRENCLRRTRRSHVSARDRVGVYAQGLDLDIGDAVASAGMSATVHGLERCECAIRAAVEY